MRPDRPRRLLRRAALVTLVLCAAAVAQDAGRVDEWPFGAAARERAFSGLNLYNLGLLGVKCGDAAKPFKVPAMAAGRSSKKIDRSGGDDGPGELRVDVLFPGGPAAEAGLQGGDVIVGAGGKSFKDGSLAVVAKALLKAESGSGKGVLTLRVRRSGAKGTTKVAVPVPQGGKAALKPTQGAARQAMVDAALKWLAGQQQEGGGFRQTLSGTNGAVIQASLAGLAWLAGGSDLEKGPYKDNVRRALTFVTDHLESMGSRMGGTQEAGQPSWDQSNWGYAHAAIFLGELFHRSPTDAVKETLVECGRILAERQEDSGGWAHGPGGKNALGYLELNIVSGLALCGIGLASQAGYEVPGEVLEKAEEYLSESGSGDGGVAYSLKDGQRGQGNIGRSAGCWLGFVNLGLAKNPWCRKMGKYVKRNAGELLGGHASLMQHVLLAGVAAHAQGGEARKRFWEGAQRDLVLARSPDGSFQPRPWFEDPVGESNTDVAFGEVWTTAAWTIVLACEPEKGGRPGLPAWFGRFATERR
jgi:hypothetical protein